MKSVRTHSIDPAEALEWTRTRIEEKRWLLYFIALGIIPIHDYIIK